MFPSPLDVGSEVSRGTLGPSRCGLAALAVDFFITTSLPAEASVIYACPPSTPALLGSAFGPASWAGSMFSPCFPLICWSTLIFILLLQHSYATATNRIIDDYYGDSVTGRLPAYSGSWNYGPTCSGCSAHPNANSTFNASWHDATSNLTIPNTITLTFNGASLQRAPYCRY